MNKRLRPGVLPPLVGGNKGGARGVGGEGETSQLRVFELKLTPMDNTLAPTNSKGKLLHQFSEFKIVLSPRTNRSIPSATVSFCKAPYATRR